jgi:hypothetical protein
MTGYTQAPGLRLLGLLALLLLVSLPNGLQASGIGFRSDLPKPVVVQGASVVNNMVRRGQPFPVLPGRISWDANLLPVPRLITIYDANQPNLLLFRDTIPFQGQDMLFSIQPNPIGPMPVRLVPIP